MNPLQIEFNSMLVTAGLVFTLTSLIAWAQLVRVHPPAPLALWVLGGLCFGIGFALYAGRLAAPREPRYVLASLLPLLAIALRSEALRHDLGLPWQRLWSPVWLGGPALLLVPLSVWGHDSLYVLVSNLLGLVAGLRMINLAWRVGRSGPSRNGKLLSLVDTLWALTLVPRIVTQIQIWPDRLEVHSWDFALFSLATVLAATFTNLSYVGMVLDRSRAAEQRARQAQAAEVARREAAELNAAELRAMLEERDRLAAERNQLLQVLAHEIRQPLHNASGALQAASHALGSAEPGSPLQAAHRVRRAEGLLGDVRSVLDNTLAATHLMGRDSALTLQEVDVGLLIDLTLGDLPAGERARVQVQRQAGVHCAELEPGLVRLALRNLLRNAFAHGGPDVQVTLQLSEQEHPPALCLSVVDNGRGVPSQGIEALADTAGAAPATGLPQGLGLRIVRRVMALHEGRLQLAPQPPHGLAASLVFPLPPADAGAAP